MTEDELAHFNKSASTDAASLITRSGAFKNEQPQFLTTVEVAAICRTGPETVRYWRQTGKGPEGHFRLGRKVLYPARAVEQWLQDAQKQVS